MKAFAVLFLSVSHLWQHAHKQTQVHCIFLKKGLQQLTQEFFELGGALVVFLPDITSICLYGRDLYLFTP